MSSSEDDEKGVMIITLDEDDDDDDAFLRDVVVPEKLIKQMPKRKHDGYNFDVFKGAVPEATLNWIIDNRTLSLVKDLTGQRETPE